MAIGSSAATARGAFAGATAGSWAPSSSVPRYSASAAGLGWSKVSVAESRSPVASATRLRSSTPVSESNPRLVKARWAPTVPASAPSTAATSVRTSWSSAA